MDKKYGQITELVHFLIEASYWGKKDLNLLDLTCGNGYDTLFLSNLAGASGRVTAFDIQDTALERTKKLMEKEARFNNYRLIHDSHEYVDKYLTDRVDAGIFNLGYLPQAPKDISTKPETTIRSIASLLPYLNISGRLYIASYLGHDKGHEFAEITEYLKKLNKNTYNVLHIKVINKNNSPPELFIIEKNA